MPGNKSAIKRQKQSQARRMRNRMAKSAVKTQEKKFVQAVKAQDREKAGEELQRVIKMLDTAAGKRIYHKNTAARKKSRLSKKLKAL